MSIASGDKGKGGLINQLKRVAIGVGATGIARESAENTRRAVAIVQSDVILLRLARDDQLRDVQASQSVAPHFFLAKDETLPPVIDSGGRLADRVLVGEFN